MKKPPIKAPVNIDYRMCMKHNAKMFKKVSARTGLDYYAHFAINERGQRHICFGRSRL